MSQPLASLLLFLCYSFPTTLSSSVNATSNSSASISNSPQTSSTIISTSASTPTTPSTSLAADSTSTPRYSSPATVVNPTSAQLTPSKTSSVPTLKINPTTTKPPSTARPTGAKSRTIGPLEIVGFCLVGVIVTLVFLFAIYYYFFRMKWYPEYWTKLEPEAATPKTEAVPGKITIVTAGASDKKVPEIGVTHHGFVGDSTEKKVPPVHYQGTEVRNGVASGSKKEDQSADNGGFSEDSAL